MQFGHRTNSRLAVFSTKCRNCAFARDYSSVRQIALLEDFALVLSVTIENSSDEVQHMMAPFYAVDTENESLFVEQQLTRLIS